MNLRKLVWLLISIGVYLFSSFSTLALAQASGDPEDEASLDLVFIVEPGTTLDENKRLFIEALVSSMGMSARSSTPVEMENPDCDDFAWLASVGIPAPVDSQGNPLPPPLKLSPGTNNEPNSWKPGKGTPDRPVKWFPKYPIPGNNGSQPGGSWDNENGHWDVDDGKGNRIRLKPDGTPVDHGNNPLPDWQIPDLSLPPFNGIDPAIVSAFYGIGFLGILLLIIWGIIGISGGCNAYAPDIHLDDSRYAIVQPEIRTIEVDTQHSGLICALVEQKTTRSYPLEWHTCNS